MNNHVIECHMTLDFDRSALALAYAAVLCHIRKADRLDSPSPCRHLLCCVYSAFPFPSCLILFLQSCLPREVRQRLLSLPLKAQVSSTILPDKKIEKNIKNIIQNHLPIHLMCRVCTTSLNCIFCREIQESGQVLLLLYAPLDV